MPTLVHIHITEYFVRSRIEILRKFARFCVVMMQHGNGGEACTGQDRGGNTEKHLSIQIQGFARRDTGRALVARAEETLIPIEERLGEKHGEEGSQHKKGAKRDIVIALDDA